MGKWSAEGCWCLSALGRCVYVKQMVLCFSLPADYGAGFEPSCVVSQECRDPIHSRTSLPWARYLGAELAAVLSCGGQLHAGVVLAIPSGLWHQRHTDAPVPAKSSSPGWPRVCCRCFLHNYLQCWKRNLVLGFLSFRIPLPMCYCIWERNKGWL